MKQYQIVFAPSSQEDLASILEWLEQEAPLEKAKEWYSSLKEQIESLSHFPKRCSLAPENGLWGDEEIRHLLFLKYPSTYRVLFTIKKNTVKILNIRHGKRQFLYEKE